MARKTKIKEFNILEQLIHENCGGKIIKESDGGCGISECCGERTYTFICKKCDMRKIDW